MDITEAMKVVTEAIKTDPSYRVTWEANIAMAFKDEWVRTVGDHGPHKADYGDIHLVANKAANNFLDLLIRNYKRGY